MKYPLSLSRSLLLTLALGAGASVAAADEVPAAHELPVPDEPSPDPAVPDAGPEITAAPAPARASSAEGDAARPARPGLTLPRGTLQVALNLELDLSKDRVGKVIAIAPDVSYGITDDLTASIVHSRFAVSGLRGVAGGGICLGDGCATTYNNVGAEVLYGLKRGPMKAGVIGGAHAVNLDAGFYAIKLGARLIVTSGTFGFQTIPSVFVAVTKREDSTGARLNKDLLFVPTLFMYRPTPPLTIAAGVGLKGSLTQLGSTWEGSVGPVVTYAVTKQITLGASLIFGKLIGGLADPPAPAPSATGPDYRVSQAWVSVTL